jgi:tRNA threonylcarbamoyladenosine biosynthesis protein TsaB
MKRLLLAIESATDWLSVALLEGERVLVERRSDETRQHASALLPTVEAALRDAGIELDRVDALGVSVGPGSFTSLRIGLATAKGLAFRRPMSAVGVSTLEAMAVSVLEAEAQAATGEPAGAAQTESPIEARRPVVAMLDARRGEWYVGAWSAAPGGGALPRCVLEEGLYSPARLARALATLNAKLGPSQRPPAEGADRGPRAPQIAPDGKLDLVSPELTGWKSAFEIEGVELVRVVVGEPGRPSAAWVGRLAQRRLDRGAGAAARDLTARYLRRAQAEAKRLGAPAEAGIVSAVGPEEGEV